MPFEKGTAFLEIRGVGSHMLFQACDSFVRGFSDGFMNVRNFGLTKSTISERLQESLAILSSPQVDNPVLGPKKHCLPVPVSAFVSEGSYPFSHREAGVDSTPVFRLYGKLSYPPFQIWIL